MILLSLATRAVVVFPRRGVTRTDAADTDDGERGAKNPRQHPAIASNAISTIILDVFRYLQSRRIGALMAEP